MSKAALQNGRPAKKARTVPSSSSTGNATKNPTSGSKAADGPSPDRSEALAALEAHSRMMLGLLGGGGSDKEDDEEDGNDEAESSAMAARRLAAGHGSPSEDGSDDGEDDDGFTSDDGWGAEDGMVSDSEEEGMMRSASVAKGKGKSKAAPQQTAVSVVPEVVFADMGGAGRRADDSMSKAERKAFMSGNSAKIMGIAPEYITNSRKRPSTAEDLEDATNSSLDTTLHKMLLNNLLPSHDAENASRPVDKRNAISGRLRELAQISLPGQGANALPDALHSRHSAKIRTGIIHAKAKREEKAREASEMAGSWVRGAGGLGDIGKRGKGVGGVKGKDDRLQLGQIKKKKGMSSAGKERERGLNGSFGRFEGGSLKVDAGTIKRVERQSQKSAPVLPKGKGKGKKGW